MVFINSYEYYIQKHRKERKQSLRKVTDHIVIDVPILNKKIHAERELHSQMFMPLAELFNFKFRDLNIQFLNLRIIQDHCNESYLNEALNTLLVTHK